MDKHRELQTDGQTDRETDRQAEGQTDGLMDRRHGQTNTDIYKCQT